MNLNELGEDLGINFNKVAAISDKIEINRNQSEKKRQAGRGHARFMEILIFNEL